MRSGFIDWRISLSANRSTSPEYALAARRRASAAARRPPAGAMLDHDGTPRAAVGRNRAGRAAAIVRGLEHLGPHRLDRKTHERGRDLGLRLQAVGQSLRRKDR